VAKKTDRAEHLAGLIAEAGEEKKAQDICVLDIRKFNRLAGFFVVMTGESSPQIRAVVQEIERTLHDNNVKGFTIEGKYDSGWLIIDLGDVIVHVMGVKERAFYNLEELWSTQGIIYHL
jgi:ribosome-associated protein